MEQPGNSAVQEELADLFTSASAERFENFIRQRAAGNNGIVGAMLESNLVAGNQKFPQPLPDLTYGQSITDKCIDWETTERLLRAAASTI